MRNFAYFRQACWLHNKPAITRYLMSNAEEHKNNTEKNERHMELCRFYVAVVRGHFDIETVRSENEDDVQKVFERTQELTDRLNEKIGFPLTGQPDYDVLAPMFFDRFHDLAMDADIIPLATIKFRGRQSEPLNPVETIGREPELIVNMIQLAADFALDRDRLLLAKIIAIDHSVRQTPTVASLVEVWKTEPDLVEFADAVAKAMLP